MIRLIPSVSLFLYYDNTLQCKQSQSFQTRPHSKKKLSTTHIVISAFFIVRVLGVQELHK
jgi:hypothetical protein